MDTTGEFMLRQTMERHHIGLMAAVIILECIRPGPWMRQGPLNPGLHKAGRSNRNDDIESKPRVACMGLPALSALRPLQRPQPRQRPQRLSAPADSQPSAPSVPCSGNMCSMGTACARPAKISASI